MRVLVIGGGAREHALIWKLKQSDQVDWIGCAPGNAGISQIAANYPLHVPNQKNTTKRERGIFCSQVIRLSKEVRADLVLALSEAALSFGLVNALTASGIATVGATQRATLIESSKLYGKVICREADIPNPKFNVITRFEAGYAQTCVDQLWTGGLVIKDNGLASGKGVKIAQTPESALGIIEGMFEGQGVKLILLEEFLSGREVSAHALTDGETVIHFPLACDHKRRTAAPESPMTGGMGAYSGAVWLDHHNVTQIEKVITEPALNQLRVTDREFNGFLFPGIMMTKAGPKVLEFNARLGDPEAQVILPKLESDLFELLWACANQTLDKVKPKVRWSSDFFVGLVLVASDYGYREPPTVGLPIFGLENVDPDVLVFHAGTKRNEKGQLVTSAGRVMTIVGHGKNLEEARAKAYANANKVWFENRDFRLDIAKSGV